MCPWGGGRNGGPSRFSAHAYDAVCIGPVFLVRYCPHPIRRIRPRTCVRSPPHPRRYSTSVLTAYSHSPQPYSTRPPSPRPRSPSLLQPQSTGIRRPPPDFAEELGGQRQQRQQRQRGRQYDHGEQQHRGDGRLGGWAVPIRAKSERQARVQPVPSPADSPSSQDPGLVVGQAGISRPPLDGHSRRPPPPPATVSQAAHQRRVRDCRRDNEAAVASDT